MSFILLEHEKRPIKLRGKKVVPSTVSVLSKDTLVDGEYIGVKSRQRVNLINHGGTLIAAPELRDAYHISNMIPATLDEEASEIECDEIFVTEKNVSQVKRYTFEGFSASVLWNEIFSSFWIPCNYYLESNRVGTGWLRVSTQEIICIDSLLPKQSEVIQAISLLPLLGSKIEVTLANVVEIGV